ncbi:hypothetical protein K450DRAFT_233738 [Umbelopsis ramanniana AG]|uniref:Uncharacterized protein n=1 Tax=Umbelopsis ramanniana AG TaxID=1314678 RepID=A0AAD5EDC0_UMBRA|nr:uncharacterized protein K450DRAFT_233738 [Umbelopsis ramanniana AG]KAI8581232.1 hypothetical protein K450DRAFT_233738 [Umbelopsis ramanniana AG]
MTHKLSAHNALAAAKTVYRCIRILAYNLICTFGHYFHLDRVARMVYGTATRKFQQKASNRKF